MRPILKISLWIVGAAVSLFVFAISFVQYLDWRDSNARTAAKKSIVMTDFKVDKNRCPDPYVPLLVGIKNTNPKVLKEFKFKIEMYLPGNSKLLNEDEYMQLEWTTITRSGEQKSTCYPVSKERAMPKDQIIFRPNIDSWSIHFYEDGEFVPL